MRKLFLFIIVIYSVSVKAQTLSPFNFANNARFANFGDSAHFIKSTLNNKWFLSSYSGISTSFSFLNGGNATLLAVPLGLQLNRRLNNNLYAFTGISVAPAYINFNRSFLSSDVNKMYPGNGFRSNSFGLSSRAELGLMYINDARTFSISGSIGVERSSNPLFYYQPTSATRTNNFIQQKR